MSPDFSTNLQRPEFSHRHGPHHNLNFYHNGRLSLFLRMEVENVRMVTLPTENVRNRSNKNHLHRFGFVH